MASLAIIGVGIVGTAMATLLKGRGYTLLGIAARNLEKASPVAEKFGCPLTDKAETITFQADIVLITTNDSVIAQVAEDIADKSGFRAGQTVIHMSGALPASILQAAANIGANIISLHPLQSFADVDTAIKGLPGSFFTIEGDTAAYPLVEQIVTDLGGQCFKITKKDKALYHAAACIASNYLVSVVDYSIKVLGLIGIPPEKGLRAMLPLIQGTVENVKELGTTRALTGPISRGDIGTVREHLTGLGLKNPNYLGLYRQLGLYTVGVAANKGSITSQEADELMQILKEDLR